MANRPKLPKGESPKKLSRAAKEIQKTTGASKATSAVEAGKARTRIGSSPFIDKKAYEWAKATERAKASTKKPSAASKVGKRVGTVAREARDVVTAVGTAAKAVGASKNAQEQHGQSAGFKGQKQRNISAAVKNVKKQVSEVGKAATTGKKGTTSSKFIETGEEYPTATYKKDILYREGKKRK